MTADVAIIVSGSREGYEDDAVCGTLEMVYERYYEGMTLIEGGARGVDAQARNWAAFHSQVNLITVPADWLQYGNRAGPIRNQEMLSMLVERACGFTDIAVYAFKHGFDFDMRKGGTEHMVRIALEAGVRVVLHA